MNAHLKRSMVASVLIGIAIGALAVLRPSQAQPVKLAGPAAPREAETAWKEVGHEDFTHASFLQPPAWRPDAPDHSTRFADDGALFHERNPAFKAPAAFRISAPFSRNGFLTVESYSRTQKPFKELFEVIEDPSTPGNRVLRLASPEHTDGTLIRTTNALGTRYQICARVGYMDFGMGDGANGYNDQEAAEPWLQGLAMDENGFYFGAIYRDKPMPHNNVWAHHERIAFMDSDNNTPGWSSIWDPALRRFFRSGWHPVIMAAVDGRGMENDLTGPPFFAYAADGWNPSGQILAVDAYQEHTWYTVCVTREDNRLTMRISGEFRYGGQTTYEARIDDASPVFRFQDPQYWCLGDPHINYYEGSLLIDDITLKVGKSQ